ncbi:hypothetical protein GCM10018965_046920 [Nonomuraea roseola]
MKAVRADEVGSEALTPTGHPLRLGWRCPPNTTLHGPLERAGIAAATGRECIFSDEEEVSALACVAVPALACVAVPALACVAALALAYVAADGGVAQSRREMSPDRGRKAGPREEGLAPSAGGAPLSLGSELTSQGADRSGSLCRGSGHEKSRQCGRLAWGGGARLEGGPTAMASGGLSSVEQNRSTPSVR